MNMAIWVQILHEAVCVSLYRHEHTIREGMNIQFLPQWVNILIDVKSLYDCCDTIT